MTPRILTLVLAVLLSGAVQAANTTAVDNTPAQVSTLVEEGGKAWAAKDMALAESKFREAAAMDGGAAVGNAQLANFLMSENRNQEAIEAYQAAIMASPEEPGLFLGIAVAFLHEGHYGSANAMVAQALALNPELKNAKKLAEYIEKKEQQLAQQAEQAPVGTEAFPTGHPLPGSHPMPK
jgi:tetratricopeptide (TPR) repeat protein